MQKILVGNLDRRATKELICYVFAPYGVVENIRFEDKRTRLDCGAFALVEMDGVDRVITALNGATLSISRGPLFVVEVP